MHKNGFISLVGLVVALASTWPAMNARADGNGRELEYRFTWDQGNAIMASAESRTGFLRAAEAYRTLLVQGVSNGPLLYNYGAALLQAERYEEARHAFVRAERHLGTTPEIRRSLVISSAAGSSVPASLPWYRLPLFWHYGLPGSIRITVAAAAFSLFWVALAIRNLGFKDSARHVVILSLLVLMLFGSSVAVTLHSEARDQDRLLTLEESPGDANASSETGSQ